MIEGILLMSVIAQQKVLGQARGRQLGPAQLSFAPKMYVELGDQKARVLILPSGKGRVRNRDIGLLALGCMAQGGQRENTMASG